MKTVIETVVEVLDPVHYPHLFLLHKSVGFTRL